MQTKLGVDSNMEFTKVRTQHIDNKILFKVQGLRRSTLDKIMTFFTHIGNGALVWVFTGIYITLFTQYEYHGVLLIVTIIMTAFSNVFIKSRFNRLRPCDIYKDVPILIRRPMGSSLPSGHTASSFASATVLLHMNYTVGMIALALAFIISFSRLYLFVHFPSDILLGVLSGVVVALINIPIAVRLV